MYTLIQEYHFDDACAALDRVQESDAAVARLRLSCVSPGGGLKTTEFSRAADRNMTTAWLTG